jgi:hypothetical protein
MQIPDSHCVFHADARIKPGYDGFQAAYEKSPSRKLAKTGAPPQAAEGTAA